jgi:hypothetical protein
MSRCILCTPCLFTSYDQACLWERVWGNRALVGVTGGDYSGEDSLLESLGCLPYFVASLGIKKIPCYRVSLAWPCWVSVTISSMFLFELHVIVLNAMLRVYLNTEMTRLNSHIGGVWERWITKTSLYRTWCPYEFIWMWTLLQSFMSIVWSFVRYVFYERVH